MRCERAEQQMAAFAGDDLDGPDRAQMAAHVRDCGACAALAEGYRASVELARESSAPDFDEAYYTSIRAAVLAEIATEPRPAPWRQLAVAAAIATLVVATLLAAVVLSTRPTPRGEPIVVSPEAPPTVEEPETPVPAQPEVVRNEAPRKRSLSQRKRPAPRPAKAAPMDTADMLRIEYQTADPNIRVIWFVPREPDAPTRHDRPGA